MYTRGVITMDSKYVFEFFFFFFLFIHIDARGVRTLFGSRLREFIKYIKMRRI